jgi:hypothetical protein
MRAIVVAILGTQLILGLILVGIFFSIQSQQVHHQNGDNGYFCDYVINRCDPLPGVTPAP